MSSRDTQKGRPGFRFVLTAAILSVSLFGVLRIPWVEQSLLLPFTQAQHGLACRIGGNPDAPISVGLSCSASDVIALCLGFVLAFPVVWYKRLIGAVLGLVMIAGVNTVRIATLSHAVVNRKWFDLLHVYIWPGVLLVVVSLFVFLWMSWTLRDPSKKSSGGSTVRFLGRPEARFVLLTLLFVILFIGSSRWWMRSSVVLEVANWVAATGAFVIRLFGGEAEVTNNMVRTSNGGFIVTQECIMTPLIPAYFAAVFSLSLTRRQRLWGLMAAFPVFFVLGSARLLVLAFPAALVGSPLVAIHGFYQFVLAIFLVFLVAYYSSRPATDMRTLGRPVSVALLAGTAAAYALGWTYNRFLLWLVQRSHSAIGHPDHEFLDPQGALWIMAPYQLGLFIALWIAWRRPTPRRRALLGLSLLVAIQPMILILVGEWFSHTHLLPHVAALRALTVLVVLLIGAWVVRPPVSRRSRAAMSTVEASHG